MKIIKKFKGGSLSSTSLIKENGIKLVRKTSSITQNRVYGYQRWYSQLKRQQRYNIMFPGLFPYILGFGINDDNAYFDMEYIENGINAQTYIESFSSISGLWELDIFFEKLLDVMNKMHSNVLPSNSESIRLYLREEITQRLIDTNSQKFMKFDKYDEIIFNGEKIVPFNNVIEEYFRMFRKYYTRDYEVITHGNITLENMLYIPLEKRIVLIDPYEENVIDSDLAEYSQLLQSTNGKYEMYNALNPNINKNEISLEIPHSVGISYLNKKIHGYIRKEYSHEDYMCIKLFEISQFIRMLPFKMEINEDKMIFFYGMASYLFDKLKKET